MLSHPRVGPLGDLPGLASRVHNIAPLTNVRSSHKRRLIDGHKPIAREQLVPAMCLCPDDEKSRSSERPFRCFGALRLSAS